MNKKGFTLVELLAVIAILAILVLIAMPNVLGMFNSSKRNAFETEVKSTLKQVVTDHVSNSLESFSSNYLYTNLTETDLVNYEGHIKDEKGNKITGLTPKELKLDTSKSYLILTDSQGKIRIAKIWDNSFCYSASNYSGDGVKYNDKIEDTQIADGVCPQSK